MRKIYFFKEEFFVSTLSVQGAVIAALLILRSTRDTWAIVFTTLLFKKVTKYKTLGFIL